MTELINSMSKCYIFDLRTLSSSRNFNPGFIVRPRNLRASGLNDHAKSEMHHQAMQLIKKIQSKDVTDYAL